MKALQERFEAKDYAGVLKAGETALDISPQDTTLLNNVGVAALRLGDFAKARRYLERAAEIKPTDPYLRYNLGSLEALAGNKDSAVNHLKQACRLGLAPANFPQDADFASLAHDPRFEDLVKNKNCQ